MTISDSDGIVSTCERCIRVSPDEKFEQLENKENLKTMAIDQALLNEIEAAKTRAAEAAAEAKAKSGNGAGFFVLKDGEKALVRPLLNTFVPVWHHSIWNNDTRKWDVNAICARSMDLPDEFCAHCQKAKETGNKKLMAVQQFAVPFWLYGVRIAATGEVVTYKKEGQEPQPVRGLRYAQFKAGDPIFESLLTMYKMAGDITLRDIAIKQTGERLEKKYTIDPQDPTTFTVENVPAQSRDGIIEWLAEKNPASLIENPTNDSYDSFGANPPAQPAAKASVPDF